MKTYTLPVCQLCNSEVTGTTSTTENIFTPEGIQQTFFTVKLSCGCVVEFPEFSVDMQVGTQTMKDPFTGRAVLTYHDEDMVLDDEDRLFDDDTDDGGDYYYEG